MKKRPIIFSGPVVAQYSAEDDHAEDYVGLMLDEIKRLREKECIQQEKTE